MNLSSLAAKIRLDALNEFERNLKINVYNLELLRSYFENLFENYIIYSNGKPFTVPSSVSKKYMLTDKQINRLIQERNDFGPFSDRDVARRLRDRVGLSSEQVLFISGEVASSSDGVKTKKQQMINRYARLLKKEGVITDKLFAGMSVAEKVLESELKLIKQDLQKLILKYRRDLVNSDGSFKPEARQLQDKVLLYYKKVKRYETYNNLPKSQRKIKDISLEEFFRVYQDQVFNTQKQFQAGIINESVWRSEMERIFKNYITVYKVIQSGGTDGLDILELEKLLRATRAEYNKLVRLATTGSITPQRLTRYALSIPVKIILDDLQLNLLAEIPNRELAREINTSLRVVSEAALRELAGKNASFFTTLQQQPQLIVGRTVYKTVSNNIYDAFERYLQSSEIAAAELRATDDWRRYWWDPVLKRYRSRNTIGTAYGTVLSQLANPRTQEQWANIIFQKDLDRLAPQERERFKKMVNFGKKYSDIVAKQRSGRGESTVAIRKEFIDFLTDEERQRINPGIYTEEGNFFIGRYIQQEQILGNNDIIQMNRLLAAEYKDELIRTGRYSLLTGVNNVAEFELVVAQKLKKYHIYSYLLGTGLNPTRFTQRDYNNLTNTLEEQFKYLRDLSYDILNENKMSESLFLHRLLRYGARAALLFFLGQSEAFLRGPNKKTEYRRVTTGAENCPSCIEYASQGWKPIGALPPLGSIGPCYSNCNCFFEYR